jgi:hypothetical protein
MEDTCEGRGMSPMDYKKKLEEISKLPLHQRSKARLELINQMEDV